jgi:hypothetical protein
MFVALGDARAVHHDFGALFHAAFAGDRYASCAVFSSDQFKTGTAAMRAIFQGHVLPLERGGSPSLFGTKLYEG